MNSHSIKLTGTFDIPQPLEIDTSYTMVLQAEIISIAKHSQENGEYEFVYTAKSLVGEATDGKRVIKLEDKKKQSVKLRGQLVAIAQDRGLDPEQFYEAVMVKFRHHTLAILDFLEGLDNA